MLIVLECLLLVIIFLYFAAYIPLSIHYMAELDPFEPLTPKRIYNKYKKLNWFGAIIFYISFIIVNPVWMVYSWFYILFTIGRK